MAQAGAEVAVQMGAEVVQIGAAAALAVGDMAVEVFVEAGLAAEDLAVEDLAAEGGALVVTGEVVGHGRAAGDVAHFHCYLHLPSPRCLAGSRCSGSAAAQACRT